MKKEIVRWTGCDKCGVDILSKKDCITLRHHKPLHGYIKYDLCIPCFDQSSLKEIDRVREQKEKEYKEKELTISENDIPDDLIAVVWKNRHIDYPDQKKYTVAHTILMLLSDREKFVLFRRFGFFGRERQSLDDVAKPMGVTRERILQIQRKIFEKIRYYS